MKSIFDTEDPLTSRRRFRFRWVLNYAISFAILIPLVLVLKMFMLTASAVLCSVGVVSFFYFNFWKDRAIKMCCPKCTDIIKSNTAWRCPRGCENEDVINYPFVRECKHCHLEPSGYKCHHCLEIFFLGEDENIYNVATCLNMPPSVELKEEDVDKADYMRKKRRLDYRLHLANLTADVNAAEKKSAESMQYAQTPEEKIKAHRARRKARTVASFKHYREERAANEEEFKDDPEMLKMMNDDLEDWHKSGDWERII